MIRRFHDRLIIIIGIAISCIWEKVFILVRGLDCSILRYVRTSTLFCHTQCHQWEWKCRFFSWSIRGKPRIVIMLTFSSPLTTQVVLIITCGAANWHHDDFRFSIVDQTPRHRGNEEFIRISSIELIIVPSTLTKDGIPLTCQYSHMTSI